MRKFLFALGLMALLAHFISVLANAEESASQHITGEIKDALGRPVTDARVTLRSDSGSIVGDVRSGSNGEFGFSNVAPGSYSISAEKEGFHAGSEAATVVAGQDRNVILNLEAEEALALPIIEKRLDVARNDLSPNTGGSVYHLTDEAVKTLPQGQNTQFNQVILQAPGVAQDSFGQLHVRGEHANLQYRINGIQLPEGVSNFSQGQSARFAQNIDVLTGALPAQYGFRTAAVIDITTRSASFENGGNLEMYGGQRDTLQPSFDVGGSSGNLSAFFTGQYLHNNIGIEPPTADPDPTHDDTDQGNFFAYLSYVLSPTTRVAFISGSTSATFQIPAAPNNADNTPPPFTLAGFNDTDPNAFPSIRVRETQLEQTYYNVLAVQGTVGEKFSYQIAPFSRYSRILFHPDQPGDLIYTGVASRVLRSDFTNGIQGDASYPVWDTHTLRAGFYVSGERAESGNHSFTFPTDASGNQSSNTPIEIHDDSSKTAWLYDLYLQDEWKPFEQWTVNYGARFDLSDQFRRTEQVSPRIGVVYQPFDSTTLHAGYARYFTPPPTELVTVESLNKFANTTNAPEVSQNSPITSERAHYFDVGAIQRVFTGLTVGIDGYYKDADHLIDEGQFGSALVFSPFNYSRGRVYGAELSANYTNGPFSVYWNEAYSVAQGKHVESGEFLFGAAELAYINNHYVYLDHDQTITGSAGAAYRWENFLFSADVLHGSGLRHGFANTGNLPAYAQVNAAIGRQFDIPWLVPFELRVSVINLFDQVYQIRDGTGIGVQAAQYGPRRAVFGGIRIPFSFGKPS